MKSSKKGPNQWICFFLVGASCILFYFFLSRFNGITLAVHTLVRIVRPFIFGAVIAYLLTPFSCRMADRLSAVLIPASLEDTRKNRRRMLIDRLSIFLSLLLFVLILYGLLILIVPQTLQSIIALIQNLPEYFARWSSLLQQLAARYSFLKPYSEELTLNLDSLTEAAREYILPNLEEIIGRFSTNLLGIFSVVKDLLIGLIIAVYFMNIRKTFRRQARMILFAVFPYDWSIQDSREQKADWIYREVGILNGYMGGFIHGKLIDSLIIGALCLLFNLISGMPYSLLIGVVIGATNIIPFFGPFIGAIPCALLILIIDPAKCMTFVIFIIILQQIDGNIIGPHILGNATQLNSFWVLFGILFFGGLFGIPGMILGVPFFAWIYQLIREIVYKRLEQNKTSLKQQLEDDQPLDS